MGDKKNPWVDFLMVIMASGIALGCVRTTGTTTEWRNMAAILQVRVDRDMHPWFTVYFFDSGQSCYDQLKPVKTRYPLTSSSDFMASSSLRLIGFECFLKFTVDQVLVFRLDRGLMFG